MFTVLTSGKACPGVSTATWALALTWPAPLLVADCDPAGGDLAPGFLGGRVALDRGVLTWSTASRRSHVNDATAMLAGHVITVPDTQSAWLLAGVNHPSQGASLSGGGWQRLASALKQTPQTYGRDVLVDTGRLGPGNAASEPMMRSADRILLCVRPTIRSVHAARVAAAGLVEDLGDLSRVQALVIGDGPYPAQEVAGSLGLALAAHLPFEPAAAAALSDGLTTGVRNLNKTRLMKQAQQLAMQLQSWAPAPRVGGHTPAQGSPDGNGFGQVQPQPQAHQSQAHLIGGGQ